MIGALLVSAAPARGETVTPVLVELFTSEGCSSCPPADALLQTLDRTQPIRGVRLIVLSEHVDYWDDLGWKDLFSSHTVTARQETYARCLHLAGPYTPQMVVDGNLEFVGNDRTRAGKAFNKAGSLPKIVIRISSLRLENGTIRAHLETDPLPAEAEVFVAVALEHAQSQVLRGENGGHRLEHVAVVRNLLSLGKLGQAKSLAKDVSLALDTSAQNYRLIAFVQEPHQGRILGVAAQAITR